VNRFVERDADMQQLEQFFHRTQPSSSRRHQVFVVHGLGGIGKTQLAVEFARKHHARYSAVLWLDGSSYDRLRQSFVKVAHRLPSKQLTADTREALSQSNINVDIVIGGVWQWLDLPTNRDWLLIIDNVDRDPLYRDKDPQAYKVEEYFPSADHGSILITSRLASLARSSGGSRKLGKVSDKQATAILESNVGKSVPGK
jgi:NB-ARC domain